MEALKITTEQLIHRIERAFVKVRLDGGTSMAQARATDDGKPPQESKAASKQDREKTWIDIPDAKIRHYCDVLPWLDDRGFLFYLPAFMRWTIRHPDDNCVAGEYTIRELTPIEQKRQGLSARESYAKRYALLNKQQREVIVDFLEFVADNRAALADDARAALDHYWSK